jgi:hypothetical protein
LSEKDSTFLQPMETRIEAEGVKPDRFTYS